MALDHKQQGVFSWNELMTSSPEGAREFYAKLLGWTYDEMPITEGPCAGSTYVIAMVKGQPVAGIMGLAPGQESMPPMWSAYVTVDDLDASLAKAAEAGGKVIVPKTPVAGMGSFAVVTDPQGAGLGLFEYSE